MSLAIKAIPIKYLQDTISYEKYNGNSGRGSNYAAAVDIRHVRIEITNAERKDIGGVIIVGSTTLYYDLKNSKPNNIEFNKRDVVVFDNKKYTIDEILTAKGFKNHHIEMMLI